MPLTDTKIRNAKAGDRLFKLYDGKGLYLEVTPTGAKRWRFRYKHPGTGKERRISLGVYPDVSLKQAREGREHARKLLGQGVDPSEARKMEKEQARQGTANSFHAVAEDWRVQSLAKKSPSHQKRTWSIVSRCILPYLGNRAITDITAPDVLKMARIHEGRGRVETARRAIQICGQIFRHGIILGACSSDPTPALKGAIQLPEANHMAAPTDPAKVGEILRVFDAFQGGPVVAAALRLLPLIFCRPGELRKMRWEDVDLEAAEWRYTTSKTGTDHLVPLSRQAVALLNDLHPLTGHLPGGWVFPGGRSPMRPMSEAAINAAYRRLGIDTKNELTGHGWRAVARTLLHEQLGYPPEIIEHQLAHAVPDTLGRAYNRTRFIDQRRAMMQAWANYLDQLKAGGKVVRLKVGSPK